MGISVDVDTIPFRVALQGELRDRLVRIHGTIVASGRSHLASKITASMTSAGYSRDTLRA